MPVRPGTPADGSALRALQSHLREPTPELLEHGLRTGSVLVSEAGGVAVGYVLPVAGDGGAVHLAELVVHPAHRREGRARRLLRRALASADGRVTLFVAADNDPALALYRGEGFHATERRRGFYDEGDALLMVGERAREGTERDERQRSGGDAAAGGSAPSPDPDSDADPDPDE